MPTSLRTAAPLRLVTGLLLAAAAAAQAGICYDRDIRPLLADRCFACHGPDDQQRKAGLRLDLAAAATAPRKRGSALVGGKPDASLLWHRVTSSDPDEVMPPPASGKRPLAAEQLQLLRRWIEQGAHYEPHWSFVAPVRPPLPAVRDVGWCKNEVDRFVLQKLEANGLAPSPDADAATLLRRLFLTLTGLPPTPEELDAYLADRAPDRFARQLDRLLGEEPYRSRYAERMAIPWLDAARYADTAGIHMDAGRQIWLYRDWLLQALRDNMPFDRFAREQLAGDLLPDATVAQQIASGFNRCHVTTDEGGAIADEYLVEYAVDRTATFGSVFLGLTVGCARCHEHKYDPISHEDFYRLYAFFDSVDEPGLYSQSTDPNRALEPFLVAPTAAQQARQQELERQLAAARAAVAQPSAGEAALRQAFFAALPQRLGLEWAECQVAGARSTGGSTLQVQADGSVFASGANPAQDEQVVSLHTEAQDLRLLCIEALADPRLPRGRVGRADNGNAVLTGVRIRAASTADPQQVQEVRCGWAWASLEQQNGDFGVGNLLDDGDRLGWAVDAHNVEGDRAALLLAEAPFGFAGGTDVEVTLQYRSIYPQHAFGRVRLGLGRIGEAALDLLPEAHGGFHVLGPLPAASAAAARQLHTGLEQLTAFDRGGKVGDAGWQHDERLRDGEIRMLQDGVNVHYVARTAWAPTARTVQLSLGSDDGLRLFVNGSQVVENLADRQVAADQDRAAAPLHAGANLVLLQIVNTGGGAACYLHRLPRPDELAGDLVAALLPPRARGAGLEARLQDAWLQQFSPGHRQRLERKAALERELAELDRQLPRAMVMRELSQPRKTYVLRRGAYDQPDTSREVTRGVPAAFGAWPEGAPADRRGLADWLLSAQNPLAARVAVNRLVELVFGNGLVRTSEDFGNQGEAPSHPQLLDWLAVELRESGWDLQHVLRLLLGSSTFAQQSRQRPIARAVDPDCRLLAWYPRQRLPAELLRDQALYLSGLLVERFGGPSVKPYQPDGLWREVAMVQSNTRLFRRGSGDELWRRSLYTYWKRACPPPSMLVFDAPTRESCSIRRSRTNTPLQALVLWNDEQFVEAARQLAARTLLDGDAGSDRERLQRLYRRCTAAPPDAALLARLQQALAGFRSRYAAAPADAARLVAVGESPAPPLEPAELAAWTMLAQACLNLDATLCLD